MRVIETGRLAPGKVVSGTVALEQAGGVLQSMADYGTVGVVVIDRF